MSRNQWNKRQRKYDEKNLTTGENKIDKSLANSSGEKDIS